MKRYIFKSGLDIIAPLKCGTRWLEGLDVENRIDTFKLHLSDLPQHVHSGTTFIWREVREHFYSALKTELSIHSEKSPFDVVTEMESCICEHWYPHLYRELYTIWEKTPFRFHKLRALSLLTPSANEMEYISTSYHFSLPTQWKSVEEALGSLPRKHTKRLEKLISEEEKWLKSMLQSQYIVPSWEEYSELEDSLLEMKCKVKDLEVEVNRITNSKWANDLQTKIRELNKLNTKLQTKLDYNEMVMGKPPIKLI